MSDLPIVVGYDDSVHARQALDWALSEGQRRAAPVLVIHAFEWPFHFAPVMAAQAGVAYARLHDEVTTRIEQAVAAAALAAPEVAVSCCMVDGSAAATLREASRQAQLVVLGCRGLGGFGGLVIGSVSVAVAAHAHCPVVIMRGEPVDERRDLPIAVGVDDSAQARLAAGFAFEEAASRSVDLIAVRAWTPPAGPRRRGVRPMSDDVEGLDNAERYLTSVTLADGRIEHPEVAVTTRLVPAGASDALVAASREAQLVVVGSRGRGGFSGLLLGSVSQQLLYHAHCPVAVVREVADR